MTKETYRGIQYNSSDLPLESKVDLKGIYRGVEWKAESAKSETADKVRNYIIVVLNTHHNKYFLLGKRAYALFFIKYIFC